LQIENFDSANVEEEKMYQSTKIEEINNIDFMYQALNGNSDNIDLNSVKSEEFKDLDLNE